ncbi:MAG TPA: alpha/beta hydrolase [Flavobacteriia bacterium]|nr:alpha/beta hydrolase [Flavobacteriia bacterium]
MITKKENFLIKGKHHKPIITDYFYKKDNKPKPIVIFCHGYKGYKDWGSWNLMAEKFAEENLFFVKFNFSLNGGTPEQPIDFPDLEAFGNNNFTIELDDLDSVINYIFTDKSIEKNIDISNISLIGHSRGGGIALLKASEDNRISKVITYAGISDIEARMPKNEELKLWKENGIAYILNSRTNQKMPHKYQFYENFMANKERLHIESAVKKLTIPQLIFHGKEDTVVKIEEAFNLNKWNPKSELFIIDTMNHALDNIQPWTKNKMPKNFNKVVEKTITFIHN